MMLTEFARTVPRDLQLDISPMPRALMGAGLYERVGIEAREMGFRRALVVSTGLYGTGILDEVAGLLARAGVEPVVYDRVESNPKDTQVMEIYALYTGERCDGYGWRNGDRRASDSRRDAIKRRSAAPEEYSDV